MAWFESQGEPREYCRGRPSEGQPDLRARAAVNSCPFKLNPFVLRGRVGSQLDTPTSCAIRSHLLASSVNRDERLFIAIAAMVLHRSLATLPNLVWLRMFFPRFGIYTVGMEGHAFKFCLQVFCRILQGHNPLGTMLRRWNLCAGGCLSLGAQQVSSSKGSVPW